MDFNTGENIELSSVGVPEEGSNEQLVTTEASVTEQAPTDNPSTLVEDVDEAWRMAYDEKYKREGKLGLLEEPKQATVENYGDPRNILGFLDRMYKDGANWYVDIDGQRVTSRDVGEMGIDAAWEKFYGYTEQDRLMLRLYLNSVENRQADVDDAQRRLDDAKMRHRDAVDKYSRLEEDINKRALYRKAMRRTDGLIEPENEGVYELHLRRLIEHSPDIVDISTLLMEAHSKGSNEEDLKSLYESGLSKALKNLEQKGYQNINRYVEDNVRLFITRYYGNSANLNKIFEKAEEQETPTTL